MLLSFLNKVSTKQETLENKYETSEALKEKLRAAEDVGKKLKNVVQDLSSDVTKIIANQSASLGFSLSNFLFIFKWNNKGEILEGNKKFNDIMYKNLGKELNDLLFYIMKMDSFELPIVMIKLTNLA